MPLVLIGHGGGRHKRAPEIVARAMRFAGECGYAVACLDVPAHGERAADPDLDAVHRHNQELIRNGAEIAPLVAAFQARAAGIVVPEWRAFLDAVHEDGLPGTDLRENGVPALGAVGYWGVSLGCGLGVPFVADEPRVRAAVFGLGSGLHSGDAAARVGVPVQFHVQWDDERVPREQALALYDAFASPQKTLHANPGLHSDTPGHTLDADILFFRRHLG
ncbi:hypothetical protein [Kineosporia succinea]|uniref:Fermentation-respiration switch protein FrsA (DUF1100 family) n=1 Tax=Kineosporia succinea TaxID=84632 RepID=A0ABT9PB61_9ACTN|nr:hypothetical protein [Kineosporia succinea]MDP9829929.1 fermentation-respiration switch protein FrsA (DUF1100 family) [Kineosporia succinea]